MSDNEKLTGKEREILLDIINSGISWRQSNGSRKKEVELLKEARRKLNLSSDSVRAALREEQKTE